MSSKMSLTKEQLMEMDTEEIFDWTVEKLDAALKELNVTGASAWNKSKNPEKRDVVISNSHFVIMYVIQQYSTL